LPSSIINPQINETLAPYQFDAAVTISGANVNGGTSALSPALYALKGWSFPLILAGGTTAAITTGSVYLSQITLPINTTFGSVYFYNLGTGSSTTAFAGVYYVNTSSTATLVASTNSFTTLSSAAAWRTAALTAQFTTTATGTYYAALLCTGGTGPTMLTAAANPTATALEGPIATAGSYPFAINGTGASALSTQLTLSSNTGAIPLWMGLA